jgi:hypothetical protein
MPENLPLEPRARLLPEERLEALTRTQSLGYCTTKAVSPAHATYAVQASTQGVGLIAENAGNAEIIRRVEFCAAPAR